VSADHWTYKGVDVYRHSRDETLRSGMGLSWYTRDDRVGHLRAQTKEGMREAINEMLRRRGSARRRAPSRIHVKAHTRRLPK